MSDNTTSPKPTQVAGKPDDLITIAQAKFKFSEYELTPDKIKYWIKTKKIDAVPGETHTAPLRISRTQLESYLRQKQEEEEESGKVTGKKEQPEAVDNLSQTQTILEQNRQVLELAQNTMRALQSELQIKNDQIKELHDSNKELKILVQNSQYLLRNSQMIDAKTKQLRFSTGENPFELIIDDNPPATPKTLQNGNNKAAGKWSSFWSRVFGNDKEL